MLPSEYLIQLADICDKNGFEKLADEIDELIRSNGFNKVAQYVGVIGLALKQQRATANCVRKKRIAASDRPMQEIIFECLKEYQDGQGFYDDTWISKYASQDERSYVDGMFRQAARSGIDPTTAANKFVRKLSEQNDLKDDIEKIDSLWIRVKEASLDEDERFENLGQLAKKVAQLGAWQGIKNLWRGYGRGGSEQKQVSGLLGEIQTNLQYIIRQANSILPQAKQVGTILGVQPDQDFDKFYSTLEQAMKQVSASSQWKYVFQKEAQETPVQIPSGPGKGRFQSKPTIVPPAETQTVGGPVYNMGATPADKQPTANQPKQLDYNLGNTVLKTVGGITKYFDAMNRLFAKLQTFSSVTTDPKVREKVQSAFDDFSKMYSGNVSPLNVALLQQVGNAVGDVQNYLASSQKETTPTGAETAETPEEAAKTEAIEKPVGSVPSVGRGDLYGQFMAKMDTLKPDVLQNIPKAIQYIQRYIGNSPELDSILQAANEKLRETVGTTESTAVSPAPIATIPMSPKG